MYFIDFDYHEKYGKYLTGVDYKKNTHGPTFDNDILEKMEKSNLIRCILNNRGEYSQKKYIPLREADLSEISAIEIKHIDETLDKHSSKSAQEIEAYSHGDIPWMAAKDKENIVYQTVFYRTDEYSVVDDETDSKL